MIPNGASNNGSSSSGTYDDVSGMALCVLGAQWGDEGKGKIVDYLMEKMKFTIVARCQGGNNAGHTVVVEGKMYDFHILPSGIIHENTVALIGNGVVVHLPSLFEELKKNGIPIDDSLQHRLVLSDRAHVVFDLHQIVDGLHEEARREHGKSIGTTKKGIGPTYSTKHFRSGIRVADVISDEKEFEEKFRNLYNSYVREYPAIAEKVKVDDELKRYKAYADQLRSLNIVKDGVSYLHKALTVQPKKSLLVEGANGVLLDIDFGTYPYVTSSNCSIGGMFTGLGLSPRYLEGVLGIVKAYQTRVGDGPFPTELKNETGERLRQIGHEYGVTTGRPRRCGWLDLVLLKYSHIVNGYWGFALTKLDILDSFDEIPVAVAYKLNGQVIDHVPAHHKDLEKVEIVYETMRGWKADTSKARKFSDLPPAARDYVEMIEKRLGVPIRFIGVGKDRKSLIVREEFPLLEGSDGSE